MQDRTGTYHVQGTVSGNLLFLFVEKRNWPSRKEKVCLRLRSLGQLGSEEKRLCATRHSGAALGVRKGCPEAQERLALLTSSIPLPRGSEAMAQAPLTSCGN